MAGGEQNPKMLSSQPFPNAVALEHSKKSISMQEWIKTAIESIRSSSFAVDSSNNSDDDNNSFVVSSDAYLKPALKIAHSLADQICKAEEYASIQVQNHRVENYCSIFSQSQYLPDASFAWSDRITVWLSREFGPSCKERGPSQSQSSNVKLPSESKSIQNNPNFDESRRLIFEEVEIDGDELQGNAGKQMEGKLSFHNVELVELSPPQNYDGTNGDLSEHSGRICSLGLVFYELFSGGQRPPELVSKSCDEKSSENDASGENYDPLPANFNCNPLELGNALSIIGNLSNNDDILSKEVNGLDNLRNDRKKTRTFADMKKSPCALSGVSVEPLRMQNLTSSLCDLVANMIDSINGDFCGDGAYQRMSDVRSDLLLMLEKPDQFLRNLDLEKLSVTGLKINETVFGREGEFASLQQSYHRTISTSSSEFAIISGPSGTGKSVLASRLGRYIVANGGIFLSGKFDQLKQSEPFSAVAGAFNEYCDVILSNGRCNRVSLIESRLRVALGQEAHHLVKVIPNLRNILINDEAANCGHDEYDCVDPRKRLEYLLCQFVAVISTSSSAPITLFLDDLQWCVCYFIGGIGIFYYTRYLNLNF